MPLITPPKKPAEPVVLLVVEVNGTLTVIAPGLSEVDQGRMLDKARAQLTQVK